MAKLTKTQSQLVGGVIGLGMLAAVGLADYFTGYELTFFLFYLLPILFVQRHVRLGFAFVVAVLSALVWLFANIAAGEHYSDTFTMVWNTSIRLSVFLLVIILFSTRDHLRKLVEQQTLSLRQEIRERTRLEKELLEIAEGEQRRIGHDLHDSLGQHLTATALAGKVLAKKLASQAAVEPAVAESLVKMVEQAIELTRNLARTLHPIELGANGLENALQNLAANLSKAFDISCSFQHSGSVVLRDPADAVHLYRIAQEAASNAIRHGRARHLMVSLDATRDTLMLSVTDDGSGLSPAARSKKGMGLRIMAYRADLIGGTFDIQNLPAGGARATCVVHPGPTESELHAAEN